MRRVEVEHWTITVADRVKAGEPLEDSRVELKTEWPEAVDAARRIAGHANTAHGDPILWIIGLDEKGHRVVGATANDLATWYPQVKAEFDGMAPGMEDFVVPYDGKTLVALLFDTSGAPFVVRNPVAGKPGGGPVSRETPWREGTSVRSATRTDLIRLLVPLQRLPEVEVLRLSVWHRVEDGKSHFQVYAALYVIPRGPDRVVLPLYGCRGTLVLIPSGERLPIPRLRLAPPNLKAGHISGESATVRSTMRDVTIEAPGEVVLEGSVQAEHHIKLIQAVELVAELQPALTDATLRISHTVTRAPSREPFLGEDKAPEDEFQFLREGL